jgi:predicted HAD superfamily Cof-like phosphohydrolase
MERDAPMSDTFREAHLIMERDEPMSNVFKDIDVFQSACDQTPSPANYDMYLGLIDEEYGELVEAVIAKDPIEQLDALVDILVVTIGAIRAGNMDGEGAWKEVMDTNFAKIDPDTGKVRKREDGKVLKPDGWRPPDLKAFIDLRL